MFVKLNIRDLDCIKKLLNFQCVAIIFAFVLFNITLLSNVLGKILDEFKNMVLTANFVIVCHLILNKLLPTLNLGFFLYT